MIHSRTSSRAAAFALTLCLAAASRPAQAQSYDMSDEDETASDAVAVGDWLFRPSLELRSLVEYRRRPFDTGGMPTGYDTASGTAAFGEPVRDQLDVISRSRLGLSADRGPFRIALQIQDARAWGDVPPMRADGRDVLPNTAAHLAYGELHGMGAQASFLRVGRQELQWGEGRLLSNADWTPTGRSLDAVRGMLVAGAFDIDAFASMLTPPGAPPPELRRGTQGTREGTGAQLYGLRVAWHLSPWLQIEWNNLGRIVREPVDGSIPPSDLGVSGLRLSGDYKRLDWSAEGAYELGRKAIVGTTEKIRAYAGVARVELTSGLPGKPAIGAQGAYASGRKYDGAAPTGDDTGFDPILPDVRGVHGAMGLYAWSNVIEGAGLVRFTPLAEARVTLGWRYVALAEPSDSWRTAALVPIGRDGQNTNRNLGQEIDAGIDYSPWAPLRIAAGYGAFLTGQGAKNILESSGRGRPDLQHYGYLQLTLQAP